MLISDFSDFFTRQIYATMQKSQGENMQNTKVLGYLIEELKKVGIIRYNKDFLHYMDIDEEVVTPKQLSGYLKRDGEIRNRFFLRQIEDFFNLPSLLWKAGDVRQKELIDNAVDDRLSAEKLPNNNALDVIPTKHPMNKEQIVLLKVFEETREKQQLELHIDNFLKSGELDKKLENQEFIVGVLKHCYANGLYSIITTFLLPNLYRGYRNLMEVQKLEAHTVGSLGAFDEAEQILGVLLHQHTIENINLRTSALSNRKEHCFKKKE